MHPYVTGIQTTCLILPQLALSLFFAIPDENLWKFTVSYSVIKLYHNDLLGITVVRKEARGFSTLLKAYFPFILPLQDMPFVTSFI